MEKTNIRVGYKCIKNLVCTRKSDGQLQVSEWEVGDTIPSSIYSELTKIEQQHFKRNDDLLGQIHAAERGG
jgi:hypothetical protein